MNFMLEILDQLKILIFGSIENWTNYEVGTTLVEGQTTTNWVEWLIKFSPHLIMLLLLFLSLLLIFYLVYRLIKKLI